MPDNQTQNDVHLLLNQKRRKHNDVVPLPVLTASAHSSSLLPHMAHTSAPEASAHVIHPLFMPLNMTLVFFNMCSHVPSNQSLKNTLALRRLKKTLKNPSDKTPICKVLSSVSLSGEGQGSK